MASISRCRPASSPKGSHARVTNRAHRVALAATLAPPARADDTLYADLGGGAGIARIVDFSVAAWLTDPRVRDDFDNINLDRLKTRLADQLCQLAGGPCQYKGRSMAASHKGLHLTRAKFNAVAEDLQDAMERSGVPYWTQNQLLALLAPMQRDIVTR
jgi:hemoglobin